MSVQTAETPVVYFSIRHLGFKVQFATHGKCRRLLGNCFRNRAFVYSLGIGSFHGHSIENFVIKLLYWCLLTICSAHVNRVKIFYYSIIIL